MRMEFATIAVGIALVVVTLYDVFHQLVHPSGRRRISLCIVRCVWTSFRRVSRVKRSALEFAGPTAFLSVMFSWAALLSLGWALIYWPFLPDRFGLSPGLAPAENADFADAYYFSLVSLATLGYGDIVPKNAWLRVLAPAQALVGFALLTAGITWLLSLYPALSNVRSFAHSVDLVRRANEESGALANLGPSIQCQILLDYASALASLRSQFKQFPIIYYFHTYSRESSLNVAVPWLFCLSKTLSAPEAPPETRFAAAVLRSGINDFANFLGVTFLNEPNARTEEVLEAYARDHMTENCFT